jgi:hypothetical protein
LLWISLKSTSTAAFNAFCCFIAVPEPPLSVSLYYQYRTLPSCASRFRSRSCPNSFLVCSLWLIRLRRTVAGTIRRVCTLLLTPSTTSTVSPSDPTAVLRPHRRAEQSRRHFRTFSPYAAPWLPWVIGLLMSQSCCCV